MSQCELCGRSSETLKTVRIEGVQMDCCSVCAKSGTPITHFVKVPERKSYAKRTSSDYEFILPNAGTLIKEKREKLGMKQSELAHKLQLKESIVHQFESGHLKPTFDIAKKFEQGLGISLMGKNSGTSVELEHTNTPGFTMADFMKKR